MCGIIGYLGYRPAVEVLLAGLKRLAYRGYDSSGIALVTPEGMRRYRSVGKIQQLESIIQEINPTGNIGIGHTRWATHGRPSEENAHPHTDCLGNIVLVHNGIIENYAELKQRLLAEGHHFSSETDTEVIAHLIEKYYPGTDLRSATQRAVSELKGAYALVVISSSEEDGLIAIRQDAPLVIGLGEGEYFLASDIPAFLPYTRKVIFLENGEIASLSKKGYRIFNINENKQIDKDVITINWDSVMAEKGGYRHFMLKEIHEQDEVISDTLRGRVFLDQGEIHLEEIGFSTEQLREFSRIQLVACGTSYHACLVGEYLLEEIAGIPTEVDIASEYRYRSSCPTAGTLMISVSQSGETADTIAALREAKKCGARTLAICNVVGSTLAREAEGIVYTHCGPEIGVASTKAFTGQLVAFYLLTLYLASVRGKLDKETMSPYLKRLFHLPVLIRDLIDREEEIKRIARLFFKHTDFLYLGRNLNYPIALEGALKLKEISYIHAEGYPAGEMKHGPIALIDETLPVVCIATKSRVYEKVIANLEEVKARDGVVIALATEGDELIKERADYIFYLPPIEEIFSPLLNVIPLQLLAYHIAVLRGNDVDQPRNLAKSVTVE